MTVHADAILWLETQRTSALSAMHEARALLADVAAGDVERTRSALERLREGFANVAAGRTWSGDEL